jgi:hypothetical protein
MAKNTTLVVGAISLVLVGTAGYLVYKALRKAPPTDSTGDTPPTPPKKKATIIVEPLESHGIGKSDLPPLATPPYVGNDLGIGEMVGKVESWFGNLSNIFNPKSNIGLQTINPTTAQTIDLKNQLSDSLKMGYGTTHNSLGISFHN